MTTPRHYALIYNPVSGRGGFAKRLDGIIATLSPHTVTPYRTTIGNAGLPDFLRRARPDGVLVAGGDGTLSEIVAALVGHGLDLPVGVIPGGTSNDFANYLGVTGVEHIVGGKVRTIDLGCVNGRTFVNVVAAGIMTSAAHGVPLAIKHAFGKLAYYVRGFAELPRVRAMRLHVNADGREFDAASLFFIVANSSVVGGLRNAAPLAKIDDGRLDFLALKTCSPGDFVSLTRQVFAGRLDPRDPRIIYLQAADLTLDVAEPVESDVDGEPGCPFPLRISAMPSALRIFAP